MKLKKLMIEDRVIKVTSEVCLGKVPGTDQDNNRDAVDKLHEQPLESFSKSIAALVPIALTVCEIPNEWKEGASITGFEVRSTKHGSRSVILHVSKELEEFETPWKFKTPQFHIDHPQDGEGHVMEIKPGLAAKVAAAIKETEKYRDGDRSQQLLFEQGGEEGGEDELEMS